MTESEATEPERESFAYCRAVWELSNLPIIGALSVLLLPFALFGDFVSGLVRWGGRVTRQ